MPKLPLIGAKAVSGIFGLIQISSLSAVVGNAEIGIVLPELQVRRKVLAWIAGVNRIPAEGIRQDKLFAIVFVGIDKCVGIPAVERFRPSPLQFALLLGAISQGKGFLLPARDYVYHPGK